MRRFFHTIRVNKNNLIVNQDEQRLQKKANAGGCTSLSASVQGEDGEWSHYRERSQNPTAHFHRGSMLRQPVKTLRRISRKK